MGRQKSAEGIVPSLNRREGPNLKMWEGAWMSMDIGDTEGRTEKSDGTPERSGRNPRGYGEAVSRATANQGHSCLGTEQLMEQVVERENMLKAYQRVVANKGAPGVDGMTLEALPIALREEWPRIREELLAGRYQPEAVRGVQIPKADGKGVRQLGIPTVLDRLIQQALHQVMQPIFESSFSEHSYGFRPGRNAHQAVLQAREYVASGKRWVVDMDLEKFFDRVNHDILMARLARKVADKRVLRLVRRYLQAGLLQDGLVEQRKRGTPQGGPLSPLLSNILLDDLDKELERRGHAFCRYADDCNVYVQTRRSGERVLASLTSFLEKKLRLQVNAEKSAVDRPWKRKFLGYSMTTGKRPRLKPASQSVERLKAKLREEFRRGRGRNLKRFIEDLEPTLRGWIQYFRLCEVERVFEELDGWLCRKLRCILWRQWKRPWTRRQKLMARGLPEEQAVRSAFNQRGPWWNAGAAHMHRAFPRKYFTQLGLVLLLQELRRIQSSAGTA
jgi:RNA-directed DNA polymerase